LVAALFAMLTRRVDVRWIQSPSTRLWMSLLQLLIIHLTKIGIEKIRKSNIRTFELRIKKKWWYLLGRNNSRKVRKFRNIRPKS
jgi:hypothetical protein